MEKIEGIPYKDGVDDNGMSHPAGTQITDDRETLEKKHPKLGVTATGVDPRGVTATDVDPKAEGVGDTRD